MGLINPYIHRTFVTHSSSICMWQKLNYIHQNPVKWGYVD